MSRKRCLCQRWTIAEPGPFSGGAGADRRYGLSPHNNQLATALTPHPPISTRDWFLILLLGTIWGGSFFFARIAVRHVRRDGMDTLKRLEKDGEMSQDDSRSNADNVQKQTDKAIEQVDAILAEKEQEIMHV